jgi:glutamate-1-semialdehyde 2,1-aminomutase
VVPDLSCYGKALGNGMPIAAIGRAWEVMKVFEDVFVSGTHGGEALSLAVAVAVLDVIADGSVLRAIETLGRQLQDGIDRLISKHDVGDRVSVGGEPHRAVVQTWGREALITKSWIQQCLLERGALFNGSMFICEKHTEQDVKMTLDAFDRALHTVADRDDLRLWLKGLPVEPVFRAR